MAGARDEQQRIAAIQRALELTTEALDLLDAHDGPPDAAAHLDVGAQRLREALQEKAP